MRLEVDTFLLNLAQRGQGEYLESAAVGEDGTVPAHELVQAAQIPDHIIAGTQMQMIGVAEFHLTFEVFEVIGRDTALDGCRCADIHKGRGLDGAVNRLEFAAPGISLFLDQFIHSYLLRSG